MAKAKTWRSFTPIRAAVARSSEVARKAAPRRVRESNTCKPAITASAERKTRSGNQPIAIRSPTAMLAVSNAPTWSRRVSAENTSSRTFWITIERPKVTSSGGRMSRPRVKLRMPRCSA